MDKELRILILEDLLTDAELLIRQLRKAGIEFTSEIVETKEAFTKKVQDFRPDIICADFSLPQFDALEALFLLKELKLRVPVIIVTATTSQEMAAELVKAGAADYVLKDNLERIGPAVHKALEIQRAVEEKQNAEEQLRRSEEQFRLISENVADLIAVIDMQGNQVYRSPSYDLVLGDKGTLGNRNWLKEIHPDDREDVERALQDTIGSNDIHEAEYRLLTDGGVRYIESKISVIPEVKGASSQVVIVSRDITERKQSEAELKKVHEDMLTILSELRVGTAKTDSNGIITFLSKAAERLIGKTHHNALGKHWSRVFTFREQEIAELEDMTKRLPEERTKVPAHSEDVQGNNYWMEIEIKDDPHDDRNKIFFFYDVSEIYDLRRLLDEKAQFHNLIGKSKPMQHVYQMIREVAQVDFTVLIEGATGTGKELVARAIHSASPRNQKTFIALNCAGLTESLLASQLFGHRRGAFTGAIGDHLGYFEAANGGTLFLDEIGDIPMSVQISLLRVLQEKEITRLGESKPRNINVRIIAATHSDLAKETEEGNFRTDLFYRLRVARIELPLLKDRREDIPLLIMWFLGQCRAVTGKQIHEVSDEAMMKLLVYSWPGNVRELQNVIEFAVIRCKGSVLQSEHLPPELQFVSPSTLTLPIAANQDEKQRILLALEQTGGDRTAAARLLGISRATFYRRMANLGISSEK